MLDALYLIGKVKSDRLYGLRKTMFRFPSKERFSCLGSDDESNAPDLRLISGSRPECRNQEEKTESCLGDRVPTKRRTNILPTDVVSRK